MSITGESRMLIDGELVEATGGRTYPNVNPATEEIIGETADATGDDMERAITAARRAFEGPWSKVKPLSQRIFPQPFFSAIAIASWYACGILEKSGLIDPASSTRSAGSDAYSPAVFPRPSRALGSAPSDTEALRSQ